jgi:hypothetical protein
MKDRFTTALHTQVTYLVNMSTPRSGMVMRRRIKIEFWDDHGAKHTLSVDGQLTREKVARILDYVELMGSAVPQLSGTRQPSARRKLDRLWDLVLTQLKDRLSFVSKDVKDLYEETYAERISLSTVSTYLARLTQRGLLNRAGSPGERRYSLRIPSGTQTHQIP